MVPSFFPVIPLCLKKLINFSYIEDLVENIHGLFLAKLKRETARFKNNFPVSVVDFVYKLRSVPGSQPESSLEKREGYYARMPFLQKLIEMTSAYIF